MWSQIYFTHFDLLTGSTDESYPLYAEVERWAARARALLNDLSSEEITKAINLLDWINDDYHDIGRELDRLSEEANSEIYIPNDLFPHYNFFAQEILMIKSEYDLASHNSSDTIKWSHIIALYGINMVAEGYDEDTHQRSLRSGSRWSDRARLDSANFFMYPAIELIALAETERVKEQFIQESDENVKKKISLRNKGAAIAKHAKSTALKNKFITWYYEKLNNGIFRSKAHAAKKFYAALPQEEKIFSESNAERTLLDALRAFEKNKSRN